MSFLDNVKANKPGIGGGVNPFATAGGTKMSNSTNNPFAPKAPATPSAPTFNIAVGPGGPGVPTKPGAPIGKPSFPSVPKAPGMTAPKPGLTPNPTITSAPVETKKEVSTEEIIKDIKETKVEEPKEVNATVKETKAKTETKEEVKAEANTEVKVDNKKEAKKETKPKTRRGSSKKKAEETTTKEVIDTPEVTETIEDLFKMPTTTVKYSEAIQAIKSKFVDEEWENFRKEVIEESDNIVIESDMQEGAMKKTIAKLNALREKIWVYFVDTKSLFESLSNKDTEGLIERVKFANLEGSNETVRKKAGVLAVMNYVTPEGEKINLYEVYDETKNRFYFLKSVMDTIKYKSDVLITMSSAIKMEKSHSNS